MSGVRFCMVTTFYPPFNFGGDGIGIQQLSRGLVRRGHHVTVVHDVDAYKALGGEEPVGEHPSGDGVESVPLRSGVGLLSPLLTQQTGRPVMQGRRIRRILEEGRFDVIHFHNTSLVGGPGLLSAGTALKLYKAHEYWLVCPTHNLWRYDRENCFERECVRCTLHYRRPPQLWRYTKLLERQLDHVDRFIAPSEFCRDKHYEHGFPRKMEVVPYFLPDPKPSTSEAPPDEGAPNERPYFLFVGRLKRIKGLDDVIPVFRDYEDADLVIIGDGDYGPTLKGLAAGNPRVKFLGRVANEELSRWYRHAIASVMPTVTFETFGITMLESFKQLTPVIARDIAGPGEILRQCGGGELFREPGELLASMMRIQSDRSLRDRLGRAGYDGYVTRWSERAVIPRYLEVVRDGAEATGRTELAGALAMPAGSPVPTDSPAAIS